VLRTANTSPLHIFYFYFYFYFLNINVVPFTLIHITRSIIWDEGTVSANGQISVHFETLTCTSSERSGK
jgi:hypothetical protein